MVKQEIDGISFEMKEAYDFSFLHKYGRVFCVFSQNDSGNISFGTDNGTAKYFIKIAGTKTARASCSPNDAIMALKNASQTYMELSHPSLIKLEDSFEYDNLYVSVFIWAAGECLFDHWNFAEYSNNPELIPPRQRFKILPAKEKLNAFDVIFDFLKFVESKKYAAVDFYDGSIMYDFERKSATVCDIDLFRRMPAVNDLGKGFWGTKRLKAPEEYIYGADIDTVTNVFTLGALLMHYFGSYADDEIRRMYNENAFFPCGRGTWELSEPLYEAALKAVSPERSGRYGSMKAFYEEWSKNSKLI